MKIIRVISEHKKPGTKGMVEAIVRLADGRQVTRHVYPPSAKAIPAFNVEPVTEEPAAQ